jgi:hypothetical protein
MLAADDRALAKAGLAVLERRQRELLLDFADALKSGNAMTFGLTEGYARQLRELERAIKGFKFAMQRAEIEADATS